VGAVSAERVEYDEFGLFQENAAEYGLPFTEPPTVRREFVEVEAGRRLSALVWGTDEPQLVFLHGGSQNAHTWDTVAMALRPRPLIAIDLPGHGHSDGPGERQLSAANRAPMAAAEDVATVIRTLAPNALGVIGMSYGGLITIALSEVAGDLVRKVVLVDVLPGLDPQHARHISDFVNGPATFPDFDELLARTIQFNPTRSVSSLRRGILHNAVQLDDGSWAWRHSRWRIDAPNADPAPQAPPDSKMFDELSQTLGRIKVPLLLARGMRPDSVLRDDDEADLLRRLPEAQVIHFHQAGHSIQGDMPVELAAAIDSFIPA
jgi:pimeloyl-ACP methyl ester carboxylesterase